jgi:two-component system OmpR family sensor kinase
MTLRTRLLAGMAVVALVLVGAAVLITRITEAHLVDQVDERLTAAVPTAVDFGFEHHGPPGSEDDYRSFSSVYVGTVQNGTLVTLATPELTYAGSPTPELSAAEASAAAADAGRGPFTVGTGSSLRYRVLAVDDPRTGVLVVGLPLGDVDATISRLVQVEVVVTVLVLAVLMIVTSWVNRLGVRPIKQMTATASAIAAGNLSHRVPDVVPGTEAGELGLALNQMLGHIESAFDQRALSEDRLRQFIADASHELRTPVTTIRGYAELFRAGGLADEADLAEAMRRTEQESVRMGSLIDDLLLLARLDQGRQLEQEPVDLAELAQDAVQDARAVDPSRLIDADGDAAVRVVGDDGRLRQVVANLVRNAVVHTPPGTPVHVHVRNEVGAAVLEVEDEGPGMTGDVAARAFERFYRADPARSRHRGGSGLGLAIVQATVAAHGGHVSVRSQPGCGATFRVELPAGGVA